MDAEHQLAELEAGLRRLDAVGAEIATEARAGVLEEARKTAAGGGSPEGEPWVPTKDGRAPLANAASAISAVVSGTTKAVITLVLRGVYVFHNNAKGKSLPRRQILPDLKNGVPEAIAAEVRHAARRVVARAVGGRQ